MNQLTICPNHEGSFDCTPFCEICEGNQEYKGQEKKMKVTTNRLIAQEKKLDEAQRILEDLYRQVRVSASAYSKKDIRDIEDAIIALDRITLRRDID